MTATRFSKILLVSLELDEEQIKISEWNVFQILLKILVLNP